MTNGETNKAIKKQRKQEEGNQNKLNKKWLNETTEWFSKKDSDSLNKRLIASSII